MTDQHPEHHPDRVPSGSETHTLLLKEEYLHIQKLIEQFDSKALTIKSWSVTFSLAVLVGAFVAHSRPSLLIAGLSAIMFWAIEGLWKSFQYAFYDRSVTLERYFSGGVAHIVPLQIGQSWLAQWRAGGYRRALRLMASPTVALPHVVVAALALGLYVFARCGGISL